jgi:hypothetical protein
MEQLSFAATTAGVYVSVDSGLTFSQNKQVFYGCQFKPGSTSIVYAINDQGVFFIKYRWRINLGNKTHKLLTHNR